MIFLYISLKLFLHYVWEIPATVLDAYRIVCSKFHIMSNYTWSEMNRQTSYSRITEKKKHFNRYRLTYFIGTQYSHTLCMLIYSRFHNTRDWYHRPYYIRYIIEDHPCIQSKAMVYYGVIISQPNRHNTLKIDLNW